MTKGEKISRNEFLKQIGFKGTALLAVYGMSNACTTDGGVTPASLTIDLADAANAKLKTAGGYVIKDNVVVAKNAAGNYIAATLICSHDKLKQIIFSNDEWYCTAHGARFTQSGGGLNNEARKGLTIYKTALVGTVLTVTK